MLIVTKVTIKTNALPEVGFEPTTFTDFMKC